MNRYDAEWFERAAAAVSGYDTPTVQLDDLVHISRLGLTELAFGARLGLVDAALAVRISLDRGDAGIRQSKAQQAVALALASQHDEVDVALAEVACDEGNTDAEALWLYVTMCLYIERWAQSPHAEIEWELNDVVSYSSSEVSAAWTATMNPRRFELHRRARGRERLSAELRRQSAFYRSPAAENQ